MRQKATPKAPDDPIVCPVAPLVELTGTLCGNKLCIILLSILSLICVAVP